VVPVLVCLRGDQQLNEVKLANAVAGRVREAGPLLELAPLTAAGVEQAGLAPLPLGFLGPHLGDEVLAGARGWRPRFLRLADPSAASLDSFVCGANRVDAHLIGARWNELTPRPEAVDLRAALPGDRCVHDPTQVLRAARGIEVGHIFQLGTKYAEALDARFTTASGNEEPLLMGCYGIGISRLAQAAVEQHHDAAGIRWPVPIAPFEVIVVIASSRDEAQVALAESLYADLQEAGIEVLLDDRPERAGVKFKDADLIGIPWRIVVGRAAAEGRVEVVERGGTETQELPAAAVLPHLAERLAVQRRGLPAA
jgi:prolyl-tRNA synthetase